MIDIRCDKTTCPVWDKLHEILIRTDKLSEDSNPTEEEILFAAQQLLDNWNN